VPRRRRTERRRAELTLTAELVLTFGPTPRMDLPDGLLREVYFEHRDRLLAHSQPGRRPWGF
jgi:hypothetical protein